MAADPQVLDELRRLRARVPQLTGALATGVDGRVLAQDTPGVDPDGMAALIESAHGAAVKLADATGQGELRELLVRGVYGYVATYAAGDAAVLTLLAQDRVSLGRLLLEGRRAAARIGEFGDARRTPAHHARPAREAKEAKAPKDAKDPNAAEPQATEPEAGPAAKTAAARTRTPRAPRTTTANARTTTES
ncbi:MULTISPECIES: roadblock/LC7 domain-containing protein [unclassified Streptomyces]|uniref:roadblock/LC7 domain-containing protein n=1 Tax=unclassified Streptomyces TaxID=2593676 RepID=UPI002255B732|nr:MULTISPECIES: roadblock/LC7 domain-containing protein [unclassified Streptomyces]MCX5048679.1 roadblock/LC7 domain-containing protein [Streptomyces sp. NBC_00474]MCX5056579.1 roadblock/LC7 domain-containing protein [Streptomyces sp. NBC_00452]MCX5287681.1 roadblock/LC7 domain-containing protein [Streptomyces sp. NBC_00183]